MLPKAIYVYDYNLEPIKILKVDKPIWRIDGMSSSNTLYAIIENPEDERISIEIQ